MTGQYALFVASAASVHEKLTEILVQVVGCAPSDVVLSANLSKDLDVDSLSIVEVCEMLGYSFGVYISDDAINEMKTVQDAVDAIVHHDRNQKAPRHPVQTGHPVRAGAASSAGGALFGKISESELKEKKRTAWRLVAKMAIAGIALGVVLGLGGLALLKASGIDDIKPMPEPDVTAAAPSPTPSSTPSPSPSPSPTTTAPEPQPTISADKTQVSPGERIVLTGRFPEVDEGALLQVQIKDPDTDWDRFPVTTRARDHGEFRTIVHTSRKGDRKFRLLDKESGNTTPPITITIG